MAERVCPWWVGYILLNPFRRLSQNPEKVLGPHIRPGMTVLDIGCAMGFFSLPMATMVGPDGRVVCVDLQERMIRTLKKRADKAGLADRIDPRVCGAKALGLDDLQAKIDFALAFFMVHEVPDARALLVEIQSLLVPGGRLLIAEPRGHVKEAAFDNIVTAACQAGLSIIERVDVRRSRTVLLEKSVD
jgi:ubiquinone/menaquinone biosynthesis C-methylase UbiE